MINEDELMKIVALKELFEYLVNMRQLPLRKELDNLGESDRIAKGAIEIELKKVEAEIRSTCKEMEKLCDKHGLEYQIKTFRYIDPPS